MEVRSHWRNTLLFMAMLGMAGMTQGQESNVSETITTDEAVQRGVIDDQIKFEECDCAFMTPGIPAQRPLLAGLYNMDINGYVNGGGMFNTHSANYNMLHANSDNQLGLDGAYLALTKKAQNGCGVLDWGFGSDVMFGRDARFLSGYTGWDSEWETGKRSSDYNRNPLLGRSLTDAERENYGFAMPQLYGEVSVNNWTFKGGHFYTLMGYESARADQRFFYGFGRNFDVTPITHSGALATFKGIRNTEISIGWVMGENNTFEREFDESLLHGAVKVTPNETASVKYSFLVGDGAMAASAGDLFRNDVVLTKKLGCRWETAFIFNYGSFDAGDDYQFNGNFAMNGNVTDLAQIFGNVEYQTWGGYLYYTVNRCWKIGNRVEWQRATTNADDNITVGLETFNFGFGANWTPCGNENFVVRPEIRYDNSHLPLDEFAGAFGNEFSSEDQLTLGIDLLCKF